MHTTYRLKANELDKRFLESVKTQFKDKEIEIVVTEIDETEYLFKSPQNKERLLSSLENVNKRRNLREVKLEDLE